MADQEEMVHDLRDPQMGGQGVMLIVRKGNKYGPAHAGERVLVDESELQNRTTMTACMTLEDFEALQKAQAEKKSGAKVPMVKTLVDEGLARIAKQAEEKAKRKKALEAKAPPAAVDPLAAKAEAKKKSK